ncbi:MAG: DUF1295 domain-containing protein [Candidatus Lokiarchaeota archaeon]|nr:DUF1295 domain-containing protein [Candidatus Lokiarchaeota archaeon]MBD3201199.1 DUF1295 domain-containing protein [Candidatus Lokiarchaeota archaeon]
MYGNEKKSNGSRFLIILSNTMILIVVGWLYFGGGGQWISDLFNLGLVVANIQRLVLLFSCGIIYYIRLIYMLFGLLKREIKWGESIGVIFALAFYQLGIAITGVYQPFALDIIDILPISMFILGSYLNTYSEYQRFQFKKSPENKGKLYTKGLFKYAQHINYFGEFIWIFGFALITRNPWSLIMPLACTLNFIFFHIPMLDKYLAKKYGDEYEEWNENTKKFIPLIY